MCAGIAWPLVKAHPRHIPVHVTLELHPELIRTQVARIERRMRGSRCIAPDGELNCMTRGEGPLNPAPQGIPRNIRNPCGSALNLRRVGLKIAQKNTVRLQNGREVGRVVGNRCRHRIARSIPQRNSACINGRGIHRLAKLYRDIRAAAHARSTISREYLADARRGGVRGEVDCVVTGTCLEHDILKTFNRGVVIGYGVSVRQDTANVGTRRRQRQHDLETSGIGARSHGERLPGIAAIPDDVRKGGSIARVHPGQQLSRRDDRHPTACRRRKDRLCVHLGFAIRVHVRQTPRNTPLPPTPRLTNCPPCRDSSAPIHPSSASAPDRCP